MITPTHNPGPPNPVRRCGKQRGRAGTLILALFLALAAGHLCRAAATEARGQAAFGRGDDGIRVSVPYVTNRRPDAGGSGQTAYGGERGPAGFGRCKVVFTPIPVIDQIAPRMPFYVADETREIRIEAQTDLEAFWTEVQDEIARTRPGSVVVFVHGCSYDFERHCKAAAELQRTLSGKAVVLMFSWPSNGRPTDYVPDQADVEWSVPLLARVLAELGDRLGPERVQVLGHSLGSRGVIFALDRLRAERETRPLIVSSC